MSTLFISHSSQDVVWCQGFVAGLRAAGHSCFFDHDSIPGSAEWLNTIQQGVQQCDVCVLVLSPAAWASPWVQREWQLALRLNKPILPVEYQPISEANTGFLGGYQWVKAIGIDGTIVAQRTLAELARLGYGAQAKTTTISLPSPVGASIPLPARLARLGFTGYTKQGVEFIVPPVCNVPTGPFIMGSDKQHDSQALDDEQPQYQIVTEDYQISMYPLTVAEYACAVTAKAVKAPSDAGSVDWAGRVTWQKQQQRPDHPVVCISWFDAWAYVVWLTQMTGQVWRLPTEAEWEKAARGTDGRIYPWGNQWDKMRANTAERGPHVTTPIGSYTDKGDASPYGAHDMAGNVCEWTSSMFQPYPYRAEQAEKDANKTSPPVLRGGSWYNGSSRYARTAHRLRVVAYGPFYYVDIGLRLVRGAVVGT